MPQTTNTSVVQLAGRILMSTIFIFAGLGKLAAYSQTVGYATATGLPMASVGIAIAILIELLGGLAILLGFETRIAAWVLFLYLIPVSLTFHNFWTMSGMERMDNQIHFLKNVAIMGGFLILASSGPGKLSVDGSRGKA